MNLEYSFPDELEIAKKERWPFIIPLGVIEYHAKHVACGCDTFLVTGPLKLLEKEKDIIIAPPFWYGPASWAVAGPEKPCSIHVDYAAFEKIFYDIFSSLLMGGWRNIYILYFHQSEALNPMGLSVMKAARVALFDYLQNKLGFGWWGDEKNASFYRELANNAQDNPWNWIKVETISEQSIIDEFGFDHAGKWETSFLSFVEPDAVKLERRESNREWFAQSALEASNEIGQKMNERILERLRTIII
jgi:creatinine amidohydrolase/Fe(II)-dependent formamide hydrolase-like protein